MKKQLKIIILVFIATIGFSAAGTTQPVVTAVNGETTINSPGATIVEGNSVSNTSKDVKNSIGSIVNKTASNIGENVTTIGNKIIQ